jgi:hypothetical protein
MPLTIDRALTGWICNLANPTSSLQLRFAVNGSVIGTTNATGLFFNDLPVIPKPAPAVLRLSFIFYKPDVVLTGGNAPPTMTAIDPLTGGTAPFTPGSAAQVSEMKQMVFVRLPDTRAWNLCRYVLVVVSPRKVTR